MGSTLPLRIVRRSPWRSDDIATALGAGTGVVADEVGHRGALLLQVRADAASRLPWPVAVEVAAATRHADEVVVPIGWTAGSLSTIIPSFAGLLRAHPGEPGTEFVLSGRFEPAMTWADNTAERWFGRFLTRIEERVGHIVGTADAPGHHLGCRLCGWVDPPRHCHGVLRWHTGRLQCDVSGPDCMYRLAHPLGTASQRHDGPVGARAPSR